jgi:hypothetical protein
MHTIESLVQALANKDLALMEQTEIAQAALRELESAASDRDRYKKALEDMQSRMGGMIMEKAATHNSPITTITEQAAVTVDKPEIESLIEALRGAVMNIACRKTMSHFVTVEDRTLYAEGHRDARHDAAELICNFSRRFNAHAAAVAAKAVAEMEARKDAAYLERNQVVAALAKCFPSGVARTAIEGWSEDWHGCVYIDLPTGQASWHFHDSQAYLFDGLPPYTSAWDGHDTPEKYRRLAALAAAPQQHAQAALGDEQIADVILHLIHNQHELNWFENSEPFSSDEHERNVLIDLVRNSPIPRSASQQPAAAPWGDENATQRLRSIVSALGMESVVPDGDLTGYEFAVLGMIRLEIERLKGRVAAPAVQVQDERAAFEAWADKAGHPFYSTEEAFGVWQARAALTKGQQ